MRPPIEIRDPSINTDAIVSRLQDRMRERYGEHPPELPDFELPALPKVWLKAASTQTIADQATLACALERYRLIHGQFPDSLEALLPQQIKELPRDIIRGGPLHYQRTPKGGFLLYSIGWNATDDGGQLGRNDKGRLILEEGDWLWSRPDL